VLLAEEAATCAAAAAALLGGSARAGEQLGTQAAFLTYACLKHCRLHLMLGTCEASGDLSHDQQGDRV
jgi:hypothetical protein